jgi:ATP-dependent helicase/nuclease subunit B
MSVRFVLGRAGFGKTQWCLREIVQACRAEPLGKPIFWILPRQATFQAQRQLACGPELAGYFRCRVMSFDDLGRHVLGECGGAAWEEISQIGRRLILGHVLRNLQNRLQFFNQVALQPGMAAELDGTLVELERCGVMAADLAEQEGKFAAPSLESKIHDLNLIYAEYSKFLGQERFDPHRRLANATESIRRCASLRGADVYVDSFFDFTHREREVLAALGGTCRRVVVTLTVDPDHPSIRDVHKIPEESELFHKTIQAYRKLWFSFSEHQVPIDDPVVLRKPLRFSGPQLASLEGWKGIGKSGEAIQFVEADDRRAEVDAVARWIQGRVAEGLRYRDIAVLMRSEEEYRALIDASFGEHGIPFFMDRRRSAAHHPLPRLIRGALAVARTNWARDAVISVLKTDLTDLKPQEADLLENYALQQGIDHGSWTPAKPWHARRRAGEEEDQTSRESIDAQRAEAFRRRLIDPLVPFVKEATAQRQTIAGMGSAIFSLLEALKARGKIVQWMDRANRAGRLEEQAEHKLVWDEICALFEEMVQLLGDEPTNLGDFGALLDLALEDLQLAITPPTVDQVLVGSIDRTRTPAVKACAVMGLSEGQFPRRNREGTVFTDSDRLAMERQKIDLDPDTQRQLLDENFLAYIAFTRASERLLLTRAIREKGNQAVAPSPVWIFVRDMFPDVGVETGPNEDRLPLAALSTPRQLLGGLMRWVRHKDVADGQSWSRVYDWIARRSDHHDALDALRIQSWKSLSYENEAVLPKEISGRLFVAPLQVSIRQLEDFRACPYRHFARHGLALAPRQERRAAPSDLAHIYHEVLHQITRELIQSQMSWSDLELGKSGEALKSLIERAAERMNSELLLPTSRSQYLIDRVARTLDRLAAQQSATAARGDFRPGWTNLTFGDESGGMPALCIRASGGEQILIHGKIDRVDITPDGLAAVIDYRLKTGALNPAAAYHGVSLRLLIDLLALRENVRHVSKEPASPVAAFCVGMHRGIEEDDPSKAASPEDPKFHLQNKPRGIFDVAALRRFDKDYAGKTSEVLNAFITKENRIGNLGKSDAVESGTLNGLLDLVREKIAELGEGILAGNISIRPYRLGDRSPCSHCEFQDVCRFDRARGHYENLENFGREEMIRRVSDD